MTKTHFGIDLALSSFERTKSCSGADGSYPRADAKSHRGNREIAVAKGSRRSLLKLNRCPSLGLVRAIHAVSIELTGADPLNPNVPYIAGAVARWIQIDDPGGRCVFGMIEQLQPNAAGVTTENGEIDSSSPFLGSQRQRGARLNVGVLGGLRDETAQLALSRFHHRCHRIRADSNGTATPESLRDHSRRVVVWLDV